MESPELPKAPNVLALIEKLSEDDIKKLVVYLSLTEARHQEVLSRLDEIETKLGGTEPRKIIVVEEMDYEMAKEKVEDYLKSNKTADIEQIHENLRIGIEQLIDIIDELIEEGKITEE